MSRSSTTTTRRRWTSEHRSAGFNQSGSGRELGYEGLFEFTETHVMSIPYGSAEHH